MKIKRILSTTVSLAMCCIMTVNAQNSYLDGKYVNITSVEFKDANGNIDALPAGGEITVSLKAKKGDLAGSIQQGYLVAALYSGGDLSSVLTKDFQLNNNYTQSVDFNVDVTGADGLKVFVCDNLDNGVPFAAKSIFAQDSAVIKSISVGGKLLDDFSPDKTVYDITVSAGFLTFPEILPRITDSGIKAEISLTGNFPLDKNETAKATITVGGSTPKTYTINIKQEQPEITNLVVVDSINSSGEEVIDDTAGVVYDVTEESYVTEPTEQIKISTNSATGDDMTKGYGYSNCTGTPMYSDRPAYPVAFLPDVLKGSSMILTKMSFQSRAGSRISFDVNRSCTVYASASSTSELIAGGYQPVNGTKISWINSNAEEGRLYQYAAYKKHYNVPVGETVTVNVNHGASNAFVVFDELNPVASAILTQRNGNIIELPFVEVRDAEYKDWKLPDYSEGIGNYTYAAKFISDKANEVYGFSTDFPEELQGSTGIAVPDNPRKYNPNVNTPDFITIDLTQSADVYLAYEANPEDMPWMEQAGFTLVTDMDPIKYVHSETLTEYTTRIYKKSFTVTPGETVKACIGGLARVDNDLNVPAMIFVKSR